MEPLEGATTVERMLLDQARRTRTPANGSIELLPLCNMNCDMCYVRLSREEMEAKGRLRTADEWLEIGRQMKDAGVLFLLLTGGEPFLYPDFRRLYLELRKMGMIITINTNGTLIDEDLAEFFGKYKPRRVNITLYGTDEETYANLCHYPGGYEKTLRGIRLFTDPDNRRTYPWGRENKELLAFHKEMIRIHKQEKPLRKGSIKLLYAERNVLAYARFQEDEQIIVILNNSKDLKELTVPVWFAGVPKQGRMERLMYNDKYKCIGFESLCPSVGLMLYEHGLPSDSIVKLSVSIHHTSKGLIYYQIEKPNGKYIRKYKKG